MESNRSVKLWSFHHFFLRIGLGQYFFVPKFKMIILIFYKKYLFFVTF